MTIDTPPRGSLLTESALFAGRRFLRWRREPLLPIQTILFPTVLLITYRLLVGKSILRITGTDSLYGLIPMCAVAGGMFGALALGLAITAERNSGVLSRFWTLPVHRASALVGTIMAEAGRTLAGAILITGVGVALGFRFSGSLWAVVGFVLVPVAVVCVFSMMVIALSARARNNVLLTWLGTGSIGLVFGSSGMAPVKAFPTWAQPLIEYQPMSPIIESMRTLALGQPPWWPLALTCGWLLLIGAIFGPLAVRSYRWAAETWG